MRRSAIGLLENILNGITGSGGVAGSERLGRHNLKTAERLLAEGERGTARIVGIRVRTRADEADRYEFALALSAVRSIGCRQRLGPLLDEVRLGMETPIRHDGADRALIDVPALGAPGEGDWGYKPLKDPPEAGIDDDRFALAKERRKAQEATITVLALERAALLGMATENVRLEVRVTPAGGQAYETVLKREIVPFYATHLPEPGADLPGLARPDRPDKVRIDWPAAAIVVPGIGRPPVQALLKELKAGDGAAGVGSAATTDWSAATVGAAGAGEREGGVTFETWVEVEAGLVRDRVRPGDRDAYAARHGVAPGEWAIAQAAWQARMMRDPQVGARFGSAYQAALKHR